MFALRLDFNLLRKIWGTVQEYEFRFRMLKYWQVKSWCLIFFYLSVWGNVFLRHLWQYEARQLTFQLCFKFQICIY